MFIISYLHATYGKKEREREAEIWGGDFHSLFLVLLKEFISYKIKIARKFSF